MTGATGVGSTTESLTYVVAPPVSGRVSQCIAAAGLHQAGPVFGPETDPESRLRQDVVEDSRPTRWGEWTD